MASIDRDDEREIILEAAAKLFNARGASQTTISDIAQCAGFTALSVAHYYESTQDLAAACMRRTVDELEAIVATAAMEPDLQTRIQRCATLYFQLLEEISVGLRPALMNFWDMRALVGPERDAACDAFVALFKRLRGWFAPPFGPPLSRPAQNARALIVLSALLAAANWIVNFEREDRLRCAECFAEVLIDGVASHGLTWQVEGSESLPAAAADAGETYLRLATELINKHGYRGASLDQIRRQFCITTSSILPHDAMKGSDIVDQCFERSFERIRDVHRAVPRHSRSGWSRLCAIAAFLVRDQYSGATPMLRFYALSILPYQMRPSWLTKMNRLASLLSGVLSDGIIDKSIRPLDTVVAGHMILSSLNAAAELQFWVGGVTDDEAVVLFARPSLLGVACSPD